MIFINIGTAFGVYKLSKIITSIVQNNFTNSGYENAKEQDDTSNGAVGWNDSRYLSWK